MANVEDLATRSGAPSPKRIKLDEDAERAGAKARETTELKLDATVGEQRVETREIAPELFITLHASWNGVSHEVVLGESDR